jgi:thioredoxin-like negative regulator of GroEL
LLGALVVAGAAGALALALLPAPATTGSAGVPGETVASDPAVWRALFPLEVPDIQPLVGVVPDPASEALAEAYVPFREGNYQEAATRFEHVWTESPDVHEAALYLGIARLFLDEVPAGIEVLRQAQGSDKPHVAAYASWYELVGIARLREPASGVAEVRAVCDRQGPFQLRACSALEQLQEKR